MCVIGDMSRSVHGPRLFRVSGLVFSRSIQEEYKVPTECFFNSLYSQPVVEPCNNSC